MGWQHHHGKVCSSCSQVIDPQGQRVSLGEMHWHASEECFRCGVCDKSLLGGKMSKRGNTLSSSRLPSPRPSPAPSDRGSPVPGLVPGLAKLGLGGPKEGGMRQDAEGSRKLGPPRAASYSTIV